jgi:hypothetical protein
MPFNLATSMRLKIVISKNNTMHELVELKKLAINEDGGT